MTAREKMILITAGCLAGVALLYNLGYRNWEQSRDTAEAGGQLQEARRFLGAEANLRARSAAVNRSLGQLRRRFYHPGQSRQTKLELLRLVEGRAIRCGLSVQLKNTVAFSETEFEVTLEGTASPETIIKFLQQVTVAPIELKVKRMRLHSIAERKVLNYQIVLSTLVVE
jgi:hypothetical protein